MDRNASRAGANEIAGEARMKDYLCYVPMGCAIGGGIAYFVFFFKLMVGFLAEIVSLIPLPFLLAQ